jgi:preprotein translocase subunit YajC
LSSLMIQTLTTLAQTSAPSGGAGGMGDLLRSPMLPLMAVVLIFMVFSMNSKRRQERDRKKLIDDLKRGDRVQTIGGILGTVVDVRDGEVVLKVDESSNTKIKFSRSAIHRVVEEEKTEAKTP